MWQRITAIMGSRTFRQRLRVFAGAWLFSAISFLPWLHLFDAGGHTDHACCTCASGANSLPSIEVQVQAESCWICRLLSVLMPTSPAIDRKQVALVFETIRPVLLIERCVPVFSVFNPACPSHAPPDQS